MIKVSGISIKPNELTSKYSTDSLEAKILNIMFLSKEIYKYPSINHLKFEIDMRTNIINASKQLYKSGMKFKTFKESTCNKDYWIRTEQGGFLLKDKTMPAEAINDIYRNGKKYGTECSTAIVVLYYKAVLNIYPEELFNLTFPNLQLASWNYVDSDLDINVYKLESDALPGDCRYFENPEFDPKKSEWRGENAIDLGDGTYYGHGVGIKTADQIITSLNKHRKSEATKSAYLTEYINRPYYSHLANIYLSNLEALRRRFYEEIYRYY